MLHAIEWPAGYVPGESDNYASNEIVVKGLTAAEVWPHLADTSEWESYYANVRDIRFPDGSGPLLAAGKRFDFTTFSFPVKARVTGFVPPAEGQPGRMAWYGLIEGDAETRCEVHHAWLFEDLPGGRVRILTQETQNGKPARDMATARPNPMINAHQDWIEGLARQAAR